MKFRKKPVVIEAHQWFQNGDHPLDYSKTHDGLENGELRQFSPEERKANGWEGDIVRYFRDPDKKGDWNCVHCGNVYDDHGWIDTLEGGHIVCPADWIITGVQGERYPCKPDIFKQTYEPIFESEPVEYDLSLCPRCGGPADNGHDRSYPPAPYWCTKCELEVFVTPGG